MGGSTNTVGKLAARGGQPAPARGGGSALVLLGRCSLRWEEVVKSHKREEKELVSEEGRRWLLEGCGDV